MVTEPRGALTCKALTLAVLARFWPVSWTTTHQFGVPERFLWLPKPKVCLGVVHQHSPFWPILARFMGYYSLIWGFGAILWLLNPNVRLRVGH